MSRRFRIPLLLAALIASAWICPAAQAKDYRTMPAVDVGGRWLFAYQNGVNEVRVQPALAYGVTVTQIFDFPWSRNISFDVNYLHSNSHGEMTFISSGDTKVFNIAEDSLCGNIGYFFTGRKLLPYITGGFGVMAMKYEPESASETLHEQDFMINAGGGVDYTLWESTRSAGLKRILTGARFRYEYIIIQKVFDNSLTQLAITARLEARF